MIVRTFLPNCSQFSCGQGHFEVLRKTCEALESKDDQVLIFLREVTPYCCKPSAVKIEDFQQVIVNDFLSFIRQFRWWWYIISIFLDIPWRLWFLTLLCGSFSKRIHGHSRLLFTLLDYYGRSFLTHSFIGSFFDSLGGRSRFIDGDIFRFQV